MRAAPPMPDQATREPQPAPEPGYRRLRWGIIALLFAATVINYIDRQTMAVLAPTLQHELHLSNSEYASIATAFLLAYALAMWAFGALFDRLGNRLGFALAISVWSLAAIGHAAARGLWSFRAIRFALGAGESGNWPGVTRSIAAWFPARERAFAMGLANAGAALGGAAAPPIILALQLHFGWRAAFLLTGALGFLWLLGWMAVYPRERAVGPARTAAPPVERVPWRVLLRSREVWGIVLARFFGDPIWWLYLNWLPLYLYNARGFSLKQIGASAWVPYLAAGIGCLAGGWTSSFMLARGFSVDRARKTAIAIGTLLMPAGVAAMYVTSPYQALACFSLTLFGFQFWVGNVQTLASDFFPVAAVGRIAGLAGSAAALGAVILTLSTGWVVDHLSYKPIFLVAGALGPIATLTLFGLIGRVRPTSLRTP
jgi:MFS transporter, ACS family, hexuronate transporter